MKKKRKWLLWIILFLLVTVLAFTGYEAVANMGIKPLPDLPAQPLDAGGLNRLLYQFVTAGGLVPSEAEINQAIAPTIEYIDSRYDCADFRVCTLLRLFLAFEDRLPDSTRQQIEKTLLGFKYWMDQGGHDSMCYWSENHQILFASSEYLVGNRWPDRLFAVDGKSGAEHAAMAEARINAWMVQRFLYGFTEFYSNNYYPEDIAGMCNVLSFAKEPTMVNRMKMIMDILWFDLASQSNRYVTADGQQYYTFLSASGRMYGDNKASDDLGNRLRPYVDFVMQPETSRAWQTNENSFFVCFRQTVENGDYSVPDVIRAVFDDTMPQIIKSSQSLDVAELAGEGLIGMTDPQIMMQWNMESFTNKEVVANTLSYISRNDMLPNMFLNDFKMINLSLLKQTGLAGVVSSILNPATNGVAIQRGNVYTYKAGSYSMSTAQNYHPGDFGDQQHIFTANLSNDLSVFVAQPARTPNRGSSPNYWVGNGRNPYAMQDLNVNLAIFDVPRRAGFMEPHVVSFTHAYFPAELFDEVDESRLSDGYIFGRKGDTYVALIANGSLAFEPYLKESAQRINRQLTGEFDLILRRDGLHMWVTELSAKGETDADFAAFCRRVLANEVVFGEKTVAYHTGDRALKSEYKVGFTINGERVNTDYARYESAYVPGGVTARKADEIVYEHAGKRLSLQYDLNIREQQ